MRINPHKRIRRAISRLEKINNRITGVMSKILPFNNRSLNMMHAKLMDKIKQRRDILSRI